jgi:hypothetical protein
MIMRLTSPRKDARHSAEVGDEERNTAVQQQGARLYNVKELSWPAPHQAGSPRPESRCVEALTVGVQAKRLDVNTDLTSVPMFFVGIHRAFSIAGGASFSTWTVVGFDDPSHVTTMIDVGGYAAGGPSAPSTASGSLPGGVGDAQSSKSPRAAPPPSGS